MAKKTFLMMLSVAVEIDESDEEVDESDEEEGCTGFDRMREAATRAVENAVGSPARPLGWQATWWVELDPSSVNCGQCARCGRWVSDREGPDPLQGLANGAYSRDGKLYCDAHLPRDAR